MKVRLYINKTPLFTSSVKRDGMLKTVLYNRYQHEIQKVLSLDDSYNIKSHKMELLNKHLMRAALPYPHS